MSAFLAVWALPPITAATLIEQERWQARMLDELERFSDRRQALPPDRWLLNLEGMEAVLGPPPEIARKLVAHFEARGIRLAAGVASTRTAALLASSEAATRPARIWYMTAPDPAPALAPLAIGSLGALAACTPAASACLALFARWGLQTLGEVAALPRRALAERLGRAGLDCQLWAQGKDQGLLLPEPVPELALEAEGHFEPPIEGYLPLLPWLESKIGHFCHTLEAHDRALHEAALRLALEDRSPWTWQQRVALPYRDSKRLTRQIETALAMHPPLAPITAGHLRLTPCKPRRTQAGLFGNPEAESEPMERLLTRIRELLGDTSGERCGSPRRLDLHRSDRFAMVSFSKPGITSRDVDRRGTPRGNAARPSHQALPPSAGNTSGPLCLRWRRPPLRVRVTLPPLPASDGIVNPTGGWLQPPLAPRQKIRCALGPWRNSGEWWTDGAWSHDEWDLELENHRRLRVRHDRRNRQWFLLGEYD